MINPYAVMYDATMDVYRYQDATDTEGFNSSEEKCVASGIKCRYSISGQSLAGSPVHPCRRVTSFSADWKQISWKVTKLLLR